MSGLLLPSNSTRAYHEGGHALVALLNKACDEVDKATVIIIWIFFLILLDPSSGIYAWVCQIFTGHG